MFGTSVLVKFIAHCEMFSWLCCGWHCYEGMLGLLIVYHAFSLFVVTCHVLRESFMSNFRVMKDLNRSLNLLDSIPLTDF